MKFILTVQFLVFYTLSVFSQQVQSDFIYFDHDEYSLSASSESKLEEMVKKWKTYSEFTIQILGHTDQDGSSQYNELLAQRRANTIYQKLLVKGIPADHMLLSSYGESKLLELENINSQQSKAKNRRVELVVSYFVFESTDDLIGQLDNRGVQMFRQAVDKDIDLMLKQGTNIKLKANSLVHLDGSPVKGDIEIQVKEAFDFNQFIQYDLSCMSDDKLLESGGMLYLGMSSEGKELKLKEGKSVAVQYPFQNVKDDMELFYGENGDEDGVNWVLASNKVEMETMRTDDLDINSDLGQLLEPQINRPEEPFFGIEKMAPFPKAPRKVYAPIKPRLIKKEDVRLGLSKRQNRFYSAKKKALIRNQQYEKIVAQYDKAMERYNSKYEIYQRNVEQYKEDLKVYDEEVVCWNEKVKQKVNEIKEYRILYRQYEKDFSAYHAQRFLRLNLDKQKEESLRKIFHYILNNYDYNISVYPFYSRVFGSDYSKIFNKADLHDSNHYLSEYNIKSEAHFELSQKYYKISSGALFLKKENISADQLGAYAMNVSQLGWINCDRFINYKGERMDFVLQAKPDEQYYLVFNDLRSLISPQSSANESRFTNIPVDYNVSIVGIKIQNGKPMLYHEAFNAHKNTEVLPRFKESSLAEIQDLLSQLDSNT